MARKVLNSPPFEVRILDTDEPITLHQLRDALGERPGVSLCVRSANGLSNRGGYFFHYERSGPSFLVRDFEANVIDILEPDALVRFINHVSGRKFDAQMLSYCQLVVNLRQDKIVPETAT